MSTGSKVIARIVDLRAQGVTIRQIADQLGLSYWRVHNLWRGHAGHEQAPDLHGGMDARDRYLVAKGVIP